MTKMLLMLMVAVGATASPLVGVQFGSQSGTAGNLYTTATGLTASEVLTFRVEYGVDTLYVDGRPNPGPYAQDFTQAAQIVSGGTYYVGTFGQTFGSTAHDNLRYLHLSIDSNVNGHLGTFLVDPAAGQAYVALGPIRIVPPNEVPEPGTYAVVGSGLVALALWKRGRHA